MARPPLPDEERRSEVLQLRLTKAERELLDAGAEAAEMLLTEFIRETALNRAKRLCLTRK